MQTACLLTESPMHCTGGCLVPRGGAFSQGVLLGWGVPGPGGVSALGGVPGPGGVCLGGAWSQGDLLQGDVCSGRGGWYPSMH